MYLHNIGQHNDTSSHGTSTTHGDGNNYLQKQQRGASLPKTSVDRGNFAWSQRYVCSTYIEREVCDVVLRSRESRLDYIARFHVVDGNL